MSFKDSKLKDRGICCFSPRISQENGHNKCLNCGHDYFDILARHEQIYGIISDIFNKLLDLDPKDKLALIGRGVMLIRLERYVEAIESFKEALEIDPKDSDAWFNKGVSFMHLDNYVKAIDCFEASLKIDPDNLETIERIAIAYIKIGNYKDSIANFKHMLLINPENIRALQGIKLAKQILKR